MLCQEIIAQSITRGPFLQIGTPNSITIRWRTDDSTSSQVNYGIILGSLDSIENSLTSTTEHEIQITGLLAETEYFYSVGTTSLVLASGSDYYFRTAPLIGTKKVTRVWVIGDAGTANSDQQNVRDAYLSYTGSTPTDLWIMLGDNAYNTGTDPEYQNAVFDLYPTILRNSVVWPAFGNHDGYNANSSTQTGVFYNIFTLPDNAQAGGVASGTEAYYSFEYANIHFVCLNSHDIDGTEFDDMVSWLDSDLTSHTQDWTIAFWHHPPYTKGSHNSDNISDSSGRMTRMREDVLPTLEAGGVDIVLSGHSHSYERSYLLDGHYDVSSTLIPSMILDSGDGQTDGNGAYTKATLGSASNEGTVYVVAGSSGKISGGALNHPVMFTSLNVLGSVILDFDGNKLDLTFLDDTGVVQDYLTMLKGTDEPVSVMLSIFKIKELRPANGVLLEWKTESEINNYLWKIERKAGYESEFKVIKEIKGQLSTSQKTYYRFIDSEIKNGEGYTYRLIDVSIDGVQTIHDDLSIIISNPSEIGLVQNFPNPFNPATSFEIRVQKETFVDISIYDQLGKKVKGVFHSTLEPGNHTLSWDGKNEEGQSVSSGVYIVSAKSRDFNSNIKIQLLK